MPFTVSDFDDLTRLLAEHPEWRQRLRAAILGEEFLELPALVRGGLERLDRIEAALERLTERVDQLTVRMDQLTGRMDQLADRMDQLADRMDQLTDRMDQLTAQIADLARTAQAHENRMNRMDGRMGNIEGQLLELRYDSNLSNWIGRYYWPVERVSVGDLSLLPQAVRQGLISQSEANRLRDADLLVRGRSLEAPNATETIVVAEISQTIDRNDVDRANDHALTLRRAGYTATALVGGSFIADDIASHAESLGVIVDLHRVAA